MSLYIELRQRGFIDKITSEELVEKINQGQLTFYVGFDPTAESLHVGQLAIFNLMRFLQQGGHQPIGLMGGATGMIGDPGGKSQERNLLNQANLTQNIQGIKRQIGRFLDFKSGNKAVIVNNYDWLSSWNYIDFLRDVGKHFSVNSMIARDSVKSRLDRDGAGISYTEFSYMLLQAFDFYHLNEQYHCELQIGGSDQWGNIVSGIDLTRRINGNQLYGFTMPLITKSDGTKFGKSESGTVWLSEKRTSPYEFYQFFLRQADEDVVRFLKVFTQLPLSEIKELEISLKTEPHLRLAQIKLAEEVTRVVHGEENLRKVKKASRVLFGDKIEDLDDSSITEIFKDVPSTEKQADALGSWSLIDALIETKACQSKGQARKLIESGGVYVNNLPQKEIGLVLGRNHLASPSYLILRTGKKNYRLVHLLGTVDDKP
ncbi:MAG: tyrosine--tRNA ligase [Deltaproteobacteria bacterium]|nr:tyrosine--tRNA ligase [Deltaproteobacteria bacterium]